MPICKPKYIKTFQKTWLCRKCKKDTNITTEPVFFNSSFHEHRERYVFIVNEYEFDIPEITQVNIIITDVITKCKDEDFHAFECRCKF